MSRYNLRFGVSINTEMPPPVASIIQSATADLLIINDDARATRSRNGVSCTSNVFADVSSGGTFLGFPGAIAYAVETATPVIAECKMVDWEEVLVYNLPVDRMQIIDLIAQQIADLQFDETNLTYETLPDPGSFIIAFENNL